MDKLDQFYGGGHEIKVSCIIPVYNAEKYVERAVRSVMEQTYKNIEIVLVDDVSSDGSFKICQMLEQEDDRIKLIHNEHNGGSGFSKNVGLDNATGDAFIFVDDDDILVDKAIIERCVEAMVKQDADIVCFGWCDNNPQEGHHHYVFSPSITMTGLEGAARLLRCDNIDSNPWCKLYSRDVYDVRFPIGMVYDDANVTYKAFMNSKRVVNTGLLGYSHTGHPQSISGSCYRDRDWDYIINVQKTVDDLKDSLDELKIGSQIMLSKASIDLLLKYGRGGEMSRDKYVFLKKAYDENYRLLLEQSQSKKEKIRMMMIHFNMISIVRAYYRIKNYKR